MRIVITGGSGLIGQALTGSLIADGYEVITLSRNPDKMGPVPERVRVVRWDGKTPAGWGQLVDGAMAVVNLAGESIAGENPLKMRWTSERKRRILESRLDAGRAVTEAIKAAQTKPKVLIQSSAIGIYGPSQDQFVTEENPVGDDYLAGVAQRWEDATSGVEALGVRRVIIRTGLVLSANGGVFPLLKLPFTFFMGGPLGSGRQYYSWIHIQDEVAAIRFLLENEQARGAYNLAAPNPVTNREFGKQLGKTMRKPSFVSVPALAMKAALGEVSTVALDGQRVLPERLLEAGFEFKYQQLGEALHDITRAGADFRYAFRVRAPVPAVAQFHRNVRVLKQLTPPPIFIHFNRIEPMGEGSTVDFTLWFGPVPVRWVAVHSDFRPQGFTDTQVEGPFEHWVHRHDFIAIDERMTEVVDDIQAQYGRHPWKGLISRFMRLTLPILFAYRAWRTRRIIERRSVLSGGDGPGFSN